MADSTFTVTQFEMGNIDSADGSEISSTTDVRTEFISITFGLKKIIISDSHHYWYCYAYDGSGNYLTSVSGGDGTERDLPMQTEQIRIVLSGARETSDKSATVTIKPQPLWVVENNKLTHEYLPDDDDSDTLMTDPYPPFWWYENENNELQNRFMADPIYQGAFCDCVNLRKVIIPPSVKYIGEYAFYNTALTTVTIARDCTFFPTSFPPRCTINYYLE